MEQVEIKHLASKAGRIGFGCSPLGEHGWGAVDRAEMMASIHAALDGGINLFDVSDVYGLGRAEETLGEALVGRRNRAIIVSKFGVRVEPGRGTFYDSSATWIRSALDASLKRLRTDCIDVYLMHYWDERTPIEDVYSCLEDARLAGKIRAYGLSNANPDEMLAMVPPAGRSHHSTFTLQYNLLDRQFEDIIARTITQTGFTFLSWGSLAEGLLSGKFDKGLSLAADDRRWRYRNFVGDRFEDNLELVRKTASIADSLDRRTTAVALRWILDRLPGSIALVGMKSRRNIESALDASGWRLPPEALASLDALTQHRRQAEVKGVQFINSAGIPA